MVAGLMVKMEHQVVELVVLLHSFCFFGVRVKSFREDLEDKTENKRQSDRQEGKVIVLDEGFIEFDSDELSIESLQRVVISEMVIAQTILKTFQRTHHRCHIIQRKHKQKGKLEHLNHFQSNDLTSDHSHYRNKESSN